MHSFLNGNYLDLRMNFDFIEGNKTLWYFRHPKLMAIPGVVMAYAISHRLSELSRYSPLELSQLLNSRFGWILSEFLENVMDQFICYVACEITKEEIAHPKIR